LGLARGFESYDDAFAGRVPSKKSGLVERRAERAWTFLSWLELIQLSRFSYGSISTTRTVLITRPEPFRSQYAKQPYEGEIAYADSQLGRLSPGSSMPQQPL